MTALLALTHAPGAEVNRGCRVHQRALHLVCKRARSGSLASALPGAATHSLRSPWLPLQQSCHRTACPAAPIEAVLARGPRRPAMPASVKCGATAKQPALFSRARTPKGSGYARSRYTCPPRPLLQACAAPPSTTDLMCLVHRLRAALSNPACARRALQVLAPACCRLWRAARSAWPHPSGLCKDDHAQCFNCKRLCPVHAE